MNNMITVGTAIGWVIVSFWGAFFLGLGIGTINKVIRKGK